MLTCEGRSGRAGGRFGRGRKLMGVGEGDMTHEKGIME